MRCLDETSIRVEGQARWLHTASTPTHSFYRAGEPRSAVPALNVVVVVSSQEPVGLRSLDQPEKRKKQWPAHNLLSRFKTVKEATLRFLADFAVPFTNNLAEQDLRMMKVRMKISGGFRTAQCAADFARLRSVIPLTESKALTSSKP